MPKKKPTGGKQLPPEEPPKPKSKASRAEVAARVGEVLRIRLDSAQLHDVVDYGNAKGWNVSERQYARYLRMADDTFVERTERSRKRAMARHIAQREALLARAINSADYRTALAILSDLAKLQSLYMSDRDLRDMRLEMKELLSRMRALSPNAEPPADQGILDEKDKT